MTKPTTQHNPAPWFYKSNILNYYQYSIVITKYILLWSQTTDSYHWELQNGIGRFHICIIKHPGLNHEAFCSYRINTWCCFFCLNIDWPGNLAYIVIFVTMTTSVQSLIYCKEKRSRPSYTCSTTPSRSMDCHLVSKTADWDSRLFTG